MLIPSKHSHPDDTVLAAATQLLPVLRSRRILRYGELRHYLPTRDGSDYLFTPAIDLLYLLGLVEYRPSTDAFEYVGS
ncbi:ABC-three component system middle component 8 [Corynebacterium hesseae]|uniref:ABC-three component system middle component 8 n=1 Tax=Corynebacterium hesseae TaxID=2913502 RepID=UPI003B8A8E22